MADIKGNILKVRLGNDTRRQMLYNANISYNDLVLMLQRIYTGKLKPSDDITLKYFDEDGDLITIADDGDFAHAREYSQTGVVSMVIYVDGKDVRTSIDGMGVANVRKELNEVRNKVNSIIDSLNSETSDLTLQVAAVGQETYETQVIKQAEQEAIRTGTEEKVKPVLTEALSIFDPYKSSSSPTLSTMASSSGATTTIFTSQPAVVPPSATIVQPSVPSSSSASTSHLFQGSSNISSFPLDQSQSVSQVPTQQTGQRVGVAGGGVPQTGQQLTQQQQPNANSGTSSPSPSQQSAAVGGGYYTPPQSTGTYPPGSSSYATGQPYRPPSNQSMGYTGSQTGQADYSGNVSHGFGGGTSYPTQSSAPTPPTSAPMPNYPGPGQQTGVSPQIGGSTGYPPSSYSQQGYGGPQPGAYQTGGPSQYPGGGANRGPGARYGNAYKVGY